MKIWLIQYVVSPYRIPLFKAISDTPGVDFKLILLSDKFKTRPYYRCDIKRLPFKVDVPLGFSIQDKPEHQYCVNPFLNLKLLKERPDVVICSGYSLATLCVMFHSVFFNGKYVIWTEAQKYNDGQLSKVRLWLRSVMLRQASAIVDVGTLSREYVRQLCPDIEEARFFRAFNCVDNERFGVPRGTGAEFFRRRGFPEKNILFVGALREYKGVPQLLEVYKRLVGDLGKRVGLIMLGDGCLRGDIEKLRDEHGLRDIYLEGFVKNTDTVNYYSNADVFALLSIKDANPLVLFEALASGIPIVCSYLAGNAVDFIKDGVNGYMVDPFNTDEVVARIEDVLSWDESRRIACERFSREIVRKANYNDAAAALVAACRFALNSKASTPNALPAQACL